MSYGDNPIGNPADAVRLFVGDISTSTARELLSDAAYSFFLQQSSNNLYLAAQLACQSLATHFASTWSEKKVGDLMLKRNDIAAGYKAMAREFATQALATISPSAGGISRSDKRSMELDTDRVLPAFRRRMMDNYYALDPASMSPGSTVPASWAG